ncbi:MAG: GAF domain-containing protein [Chloroflexi bacterium]|nr:GAF domain-containing protein [Chloroflexota bacterium]
MSAKPTLRSADQNKEQRYQRNAIFIILVVMIATLPTSALFSYVGYTNNLPQLYISAAILLVTFFFDFFPLSLARRGQTNRAVILLTAAFLLNVMIARFLIQGLGLIIALSIVLVVLAVTGFTMPSQYSFSGLAVAIGFALLSVFLDNALGADRVRAPELQNYTPYIVGMIATPILIVFIREYNHFSLQTKITLGIMLTGGVTVATLLYFGVNRTSAIGEFLTRQYELSVKEKSEIALSNKIREEAQKINDLFLEIQDDLQTMAQYRSNLELQSSLIASATYWDATERLIRLPGGQLGNSETDPASVFIPSAYALTDEMIADLNTSVYLDFLAPNILAAHPEMAAIYYISQQGYTVYYPNISLAENIPPDFDPTKEPFFTIAAPQQNPERLPRTTNPYQDPAGAGLIATVSIPVYSRSAFEGVVSADVQLARLAKSIADIKLTEGGFSFLVDKDGLIVAMTETGYQYFGLEPETVEVNQSPKQSILNSPFEDKRDLALQVFASETGISRFAVNGIDTYLAVSTLESTGYKLVSIAPAAELDREFIDSQTRVEQENQNLIRDISSILTILFVGALITSFIVGGIITRPLKRLTETVEQIAAGNLAARATAQSGDESGALARSFNAMADQLTETLQRLEDRVAERTSKLEEASQVNARRAALFESIARISRIISSTRSLDLLFPQIAETISNQLGYYHVGIFLVDVHKEYAVLVAANSDGGRKMLARNHRLRVGETGIVGYVTATGQPRIALDVGQDAVFFNNPNLPETHSEIALPLRSGAEVIGALDVQSKLINAFSEEDINVLSALADQVSIAIQNARSFQQSLEALQQAERTAARLSEKQWSEFIQRQKPVGYHFDGINTQQVKAGQKSFPNEVAIPIMLRGVQIGTLKLSASDPEHQWDEHEIAMAQATAERTALAIETARLLDDAQKRAAKERAIGKISARIGSLVNIDNIVQTTIQELGNTLPGTDVAIQFTSPNSARDK